MSQKEGRQKKIKDLLEFFDGLLPEKEKTERARKYFLENQIEDGVNHTEFDKDVLGSFEEYDGSDDHIIYGVDFCTRINLAQLLAKYTHYVG